MRFFLLAPILWLALIQLVMSQTPTAQDLAFFEQKVRPLLVEKCFECHSQKSDKPNGGLRLDARDSILAGGDNGPAIVVEQPQQSLLVRAIHYRDPDIEMPPDGKLSDREIATIEDWVRRGLPYPDSFRDGPAVTKRVDIQEGKKHWAFQPLSMPSPAVVTKPSWPMRRIDAFILAEQEKQGLHPSAPASKAALLRRAKFDLIGLPPTPDEVEAFLNDSLPDAFQRRIEHWMSSPRYGERWARFWLELARYCDIPESWAETEGNSYLYRDWVVGALNDDMPYDRFAMLQIAADHMPEADPTDLAALGFIGLSPSYWKELQLPVEIIKTIVSDEYEERIHTFSSTFLGLNLACARCHDHKHDPIAVEDYYALAGVFASTRSIDRALALGVDSRKVYEAHQQVKKLDQEIKKIQGEINKLNNEQEEDSKKRSAKQDELQELNKQLLAARSTAGFESVLAPGVLDASLEVVEAPGTHGSRIVYHPAPKDLAVEIRGNPNRTGPIVPRRFIAVLSKDPPSKFLQGSGRLELAQSMIRECQPLVARVLVNRIWKLQFGRGLVETPSDFGFQGDPPSHPELLDDLAQRFIAHSWSLKWLHCELMLSAAYQQASDPNPQTDPLNRFVTHAPLRRLDVEQWRDAMLFTTGTLDNSLGGGSEELSQPGHHRRTLYGTVKRRELTDILRLHDFPDPITHSPSRTSTMTPLQQLFTLNSPFMLEQAAELVKRLQSGSAADPARQVEQVYQRLFARLPSQNEMRLGLEFVSGEDTQDWKHYVQMLLASNEFYFVD